MRTSFLALFLMAISFSTVLADDTPPLPDRKPIHAEEAAAKPQIDWDNIIMFETEPSPMPKLNPEDFPTRPQ